MSTANMETLAAEIAAGLKAGKTMTVVLTEVTTRHPQALDDTTAAAAFDRAAQMLTEEAAELRRFVNARGQS